MVVEKKFLWEFLWKESKVIRAIITFPIFEDVIGEDRFAKLYRGHCICKTQEKVAIRKLKANENAAFNEKKFLKEAEELVKFKLSNIVKTLGVLIDEKAFVQEYCVKVVQGNEIHFLLGLIYKLNEDFPLEFKSTCFLNITIALCGRLKTWKCIGNVFSGRWIDFQAGWHCSWNQETERL